MRSQSCDFDPIEVMFLEEEEKTQEYSFLSRTTEGRLHEASARRSPCARQVRACAEAKHVRNSI